MTSLLTFLHIASVIWFVSGAVFIQGQAILRARTDHLAVIAAAQRSITVANRIFVMPGFLLVLLSGLASAVAQELSLLELDWLSTSIILYIIAAIPGIAYHIPASRRIARLLEAPTQQGKITPELQSAVRNPALMRVGYFQILLFTIILALMVFKPF